MRLSLILFLVFISVADCFCQNRNSVWCFGDSAGIDFSNPNNPVPITSSMDGRGSCVSIADSNGQLLFYANTNGSPGHSTKVRNKNNLLMQNGDSVVGEAWYKELVAIENPTYNGEYYLFSLGAAAFYGCYYSIIDMNQNGGLGAVTQKNIQLQSFPAVDCVVAIKHGNGRDWWVIFRRNDYNSGGSNNLFYEYLVTPTGISSVQLVSCGTPNPTGFNRLCVSTDGKKIASVNAASLVEIYNFDRCTGNIDNPITIEPQSLSAPYKENWECEFSPNNNLLYVSKVDTDCVLYQYNLLDSNPALSKDTIWYTTYPITAIGAVRRAPDNKLYVSGAYYNGFTWNYPYPDSMYNVYNMNLSVINYPDSLGAACDFQPYSFYLGGKRTYWGLPNNPDYDMPRDSGSVCDTIQWTGVQNIEQAKGLMYVTYVNDWQKLFVNAQGLKGRSFTISVYDMVGNVIYTEEGKLSSQYFTRDLNMAAFAKGMYIVNFVTDKERLAKKFIKD